MNNIQDFNIGDIVILKKGHPCGTNEWEIRRTGIDFKLKCLGCERQIMIPRREFLKKLKKKK
ncbi:MAG: DUF951 domain-containing protein [Andreesenia angusta]|nr:DUF951 domain-containing protein [Andreesenia angusta]